VRGWREAQKGSRLAEKRQRPKEEGQESFIKGRKGQDSKRLKITQIP
jgi:hypothetical protein